MIVVADTGPISYLVQLGLVDLLSERYGRVLLPEAVFLELQHPRAPLAVREWLLAQPAWVEIVHVGLADVSLPRNLGPGEREAITLALRLDSELLLDDKAATLQARKYGLTPTGTLVVLVEAAQNGTVDLPEALARLVALGFYMNPPLYARILALGRHRTL